MSTTTATTHVKTHTIDPGAKLIAHSGYEGGEDLFSVQATGRRFVLAELNTHRSLNKNSASSRAIPFPKQVQRIIDSLAYPEIWAAEQKGMSGGAEVEDVEGCRELWEEASREALDVAHRLAEKGVHKSVVNRLLEPFMWHTVILTGTAWRNFFDQRCNPLAQPEIRVMAEAIEEVMGESDPTMLDMGQWHAPYTDERTWDQLLGQQGDPCGDIHSEDWMKIAQISAGCCARTSYLTQEGHRDVEKDLRLYDDTLVKNGHWSPLEHVATPWPANRQADPLFFNDALGGAMQVVATKHLPRVGNLVGWRTLRVTVEAQRGVVTYR